MKMVGNLRALPHGGTEVVGTSEITMTGLLAQFGSRVIEEISNQMFEQFTQNLQKNIDGLGDSVTEGKPTQPLSAIPLVAAATKMATLRLFRRIIGRSSET